MKYTNTGLIRRLDNLGRIVIPKEIRSSLRMKDGDPISISVCDQTIQLEKYQPLNSIADVSKSFLKAYADTCGGGMCVICNTDYLVSARGISISDKHPLSSMIREYIQNQKLYVSGDPATYVSADSEPITLFDDNNKYPIEALYPVGTKEEPLGAVLLLQYRHATALEMVSAKLIAAMITEFLLQK